MSRMSAFVDPERLLACRQVHRDDDEKREGVAARGIRYGKSVAKIAYLSTSPGRVVELGDSRLIACRSSEGPSGFFCNDDAHPWVGFRCRHNAVVTSGR